MTQGCENLPITVILCMVLILRGQIIPKLIIENILRGWNNILLEIGELVKRDLDVIEYIQEF